MHFVSLDEVHMDNKIYDVGILVYLIFAPVEQFVLNPEYKVTLSGVTILITESNKLTIM